MKRQAREALSVLLSIIMMTSTIPAQALAEEANVLSTAAKQVQTVLSDVSSEGSAVSLPDADADDDRDSAIGLDDQNSATPPPIQ